MCAEENSSDAVASQPAASITIYRMMPGRVPFLVGLALLLCALIFYYLAVLRIDYAKTALLDLRPYPDAAEYFAQAQAMVHGDPPSIQIGYDKLPSRYPPGYPALMLPWLKVLRKSNSILAPFRTNQTIGLFLLLAVFATYCYLAMPLAGGLATLLLATLPAFFTYCRSSLSEISGSALVALAFIFVYLGLKDKRRWPIYAAAVLLGLSLNIRMQLMFFGPLLLAMALFPGKTSRVDWLVNCAAVLLVFALAASPIFILNAFQFHNPFKTGYEFWVPVLFEKHLLFSPHYIPGHAAMIWSHCVLRRTDFNVANRFGTGTYFVPAYVLLVCGGFAFIRVNRFTICAFLAGSTFLLATASYRFVDGRFYIPILILSVAVAILPVEWALRRVMAGPQKLAAFCIFILFVATCAGYPSQSGYKPRDGRSQAWDALHVVDPARQSPRFLAQAWLSKSYGQKPGIVLSDIDPVYLNALLPKPFVAAPLDEKHHYAFSKLWRYDREDSIALVRNGLSHSIPIYALFVSMKEMTSASPRLPAIDGYQWTTIDSGNYAVILMLTPVMPR